MIYKTVSIYEVLARLFRLRFFDSSIQNDLIEWIGEGLDKLQVSSTLTNKICYLDVKNYKARIPCGLVEHDVMIYNKKRLRFGNSQLSGSLEDKLRLNDYFDKSIFKTDTNITSNDSIETRLRSDDLKIALNDYCDVNWYKIQLDWFHFSFVEGTVICLYREKPIDEKGYPLIPDNENLKTALFWYMIYTLNMAGYEFPKREMNDLEYCRINFETYGRRAIDEIKEMNIDKAESYRQSSVRMVTPYSFYTDFFTNTEQYNG